MSEAATAPSPPPYPQVDPGTFKRFLEVLFKHVDREQAAKWYVALRGFEYFGEERALIDGFAPCDKSLPDLAAASATGMARRTSDKVAVFSPPVCLFGDMTTNGKRMASEGNVACCPVIVLELDENPKAMLARAVEILGKPPTMTVHSGGVWQGPDGPEDKLHAYWRLTEPAVEFEQRVALKRVRLAMSLLCGGDGTAAPLCHPLRWPGSWHTKSTPRLCTIESVDGASEIDLQEAVDLCERAAAVQGLDLSAVPALVPRREGFKTPTPLHAEALQACAKTIPNPYEMSWDKWNVVGMALFDASHGSEDGREAFHTFSEKNVDKYEFDVVDQRWDHFHRSPPDQVSAGKLLYLAREADPTFVPPFNIDGCWDAEAGAAVLAAEATAGQLPDVTSGPVPSKFQLLTFDEVADMALTASAKPLVEGLLDQGAMSVLYGDSNVGKTFVMMSLAYHVAAGLPWGGRQTEQCSVVYFVTEGSRGAGKRAAALRMKYGPCADFHFVLTPINLREEKADLKPIIEMLRKVDRLGLAVIDTLSRALAGGDESSSVDMGALVQNFDAIRAAVSCHLTVVHHTGKNLARGARGHSLLRAATDTEIEVSAGKITVTKQRDLEKCAEATFGLETVVVGRNERGREVTSCTLRFIEANETKAGELTPREADVMRAIRSVIAAGDNPANGAKLSAIAAELNEPGPEGANRIRDPIKNLVDKNHLVKVRQGFWVPRDIQIAGFFQPIDGPEEAPKNLGKIRSTESPQNSKPQPTVFEPPVGVFG